MYKSNVNEMMYMEIRWQHNMVLLHDALASCNNGIVTCCFNDEAFSCELTALISRSCRMQEQEYVSSL